MTLALFLLMNVGAPAYLGYAGYPVVALVVLVFTIASYKVARGWRVDEKGSVGASIVRGYLFSIVVAAPVYFIARVAGASI